MSVIALKRNYQLEMPKSYVNVESEEMEYVDGGSPLVVALGVITGLVAAGYGVMQIGIECGKYVYNNWGERNGTTMNNFKRGGKIVLGYGASWLFEIGLDNGWIQARNDAK